MCESYSLKKTHREIILGIRTVGENARGMNAKKGGFEETTSDLIIWSPQKGRVGRRVPSVLFYDSD